jgi:hypothetical protein
VGRLLASLHPETEELAPLAAHMIVRLLNAGHDDVAYNLVQFLAENSAEESSRLVSAEFLEQLVRTNATVTKLLWFLKVCKGALNYCTGRVVEFLEQLVRTNATVTKLLWFLKVCKGALNYCTGRVVEFLEQLVRTNATVTKLLWFLKVCTVNYCTGPCC